jgi:hypothetical protein
LLHVYLTSHDTEERKVSYCRKYGRILQKGRNVYTKRRKVAYCRKESRILEEERQDILQEGKVHIASG